MPGPKLIMVVDDEAAVRDVLCFFLELKGYKTVARSNGQSAISYAEKKKPDVVLLDIKMPGMNGIETCSRLKQVLPSSPGTGIIMITGHDSKGNLENAYSSGAIDFVRKPFELEDVHRRINTWFEVRNIESRMVRSLVYSAKVRWLTKGCPA
ncbi:MAG TPA: response regulator [Nitrospirae bacterium]|nr:alkaline phosphatase synthesis transcriptional regulatory protein PhoP [bacterium BMS3Bbin08]HDH50124.1 response regulator [Nitrospirota bacterium]HDK41272.1 response regulator [Nitrospirota bacterium]HDK81477.1 response regulator [Nitrospirota bacterium]